MDAAQGVVTGYSDARSGLSNGATRMFMYATFDKPMRSDQTFDAREVNMRIATSLISVEQAKRNLAQEIAPTDTFETVRDRAQNAWDDKLKVVEVEGATEDQQTTLYSNLYRLFLYPNSAHENVADSGQAPNWRHAVQSSTSTPPSTPTQTGAPVVDGKVYVNNGFWDTYRTAWSAYALFSPGIAGELVDGFVQQYRDGGWVSRWSSPGYANLMTGTSSDVSFADAYVKGVKGFNARDAYDAAVRNATVAPPGSDPNNPSVGRKGLVTSTFLGFTPSAVSEGVSWALEGYINDFGISNMAKALAADPATSAADRKRYLEEHEYFSERARNYVNMFDPVDRVLPGARRERALEVLAGGLRPARLGPRARLHGDRRLELRVPRAARRQRASPTSTAAAATSGRSWTRSSARPRPPSSPAPTAGSSTRWSRPGTSGWASGASATRCRTTSRGCTPTRSSRTRPRRRCARSCAACTSARRSGRGTPATRTTARRRPGTCSPRWGSTRSRSAAPTT